MTVALQFAEFAQAVDIVDEAVRHHALLAVQDLLGAAVAGAATTGGQSARTATAASWGVGPANVWFSSDRQTVPGAAFVNAAYGSMLDIDDGSRPAAGHPGAAVVPAALATAQAIGANADRLLTAIALGYEIGIRVAAARDFSTLATTDSGLWCGYGVAAAAGWLRDLPPPIIAHAMAIAGTTAPGQSATAWTRHMGNSVKEGIPWATATALTAVDLAAAGYTGPIDLLDEPGRYDQAALLRDLGGNWRIAGVYHKLYSCCRWAHAPIDAVLAIAAEAPIVPEAVQSIEVATFSRALTLNNDSAPRTLESAQYSLPFCVALAAVRGASALLPMHEAQLSDPVVLDLARRVRLSVEPAFDALFPAAAPGQVSVVSGGRAVTRTVMTPKGEPANPLSRDELDRKFDALARPRLGQAADGLKASIRQLQPSGGLDALFQAVRTPLLAPAPIAEIDASSSIAHTVNV